MEVVEVLSEVLAAWKKEADMGDGFNEKDAELYLKALRIANDRNTISKVVCSNCDAEVKPVSSGYFCPKCLCDM